MKVYLLNTRWDEKTYTRVFKTKESMIDAYTKYINEEYNRFKAYPNSPTTVLKVEDKGHRLNVYKIKENHKRAKEYLPAWGNSYEEREVED